MHLSNPRRWVSHNYAEKEMEKLWKHTQRKLDRSRVKGDRDLEEKAADKGCRSQPRDRGKVAGKGKSEKNRGGKAEAFRGGPNKTTRGELKGKEADFNGSEWEVTDLEKEGAEALKPTVEIAKTLPQKVEGTKALRGWVPT